MKKLFIEIHRTLGVLMSIFFVMWFLTGFVMIKHGYPSMRSAVHQKALMPIMPLDSSQVAQELNALPQPLPEDLSLRMLDGKTYAYIYEHNGQTRIFPSGNSPRDTFSIAELDNYAKRAVSAPIESVDTLKDLDQWIPFAAYRSKMPILRYHYNDGKGSQLYVSKVTGAGVQFTDREERFYSWIGPIPHWLYLMELRSDRETWSAVVITISAIGTLMCLTGFILGIWAYVHRYRRKGDFKSMYPRGAFRLHHIFGFVFGLFVFSFSFSGMMSLQRIPQWLRSTERPELADLARDHSLRIRPQDYPLSVDALTKQLADKHALQIHYRSWGDKPYYEVLTPDTTLYVDASDSIARPLELSQADIERWLKVLHPNDAFKISVQTDYDNYYIKRSRNLPLPVYRVEVQDADRTSYYIDAKRGDVLYFNANTRMRKWVYQALHSFSFKGLEYRGALWQVLMYTLLVGGTIVSVTGIILAYRFSTRKRKRK